MIQQTVNDMYNYSKSSGAKLLSEYKAQFWNEYINNSDRYDALFRRLYKSFRYFMQEDGETIDTITTNFISDVYNHLMINDKKYAELYRVHVIPDEDYSITDNYNVTEKMNKDSSNDYSNIYGERTDKTTNNFGARTDTNEVNTGAQTNTGTDTIAGFNSSGFENDSKVTDDIGARTDNSTNVIGAQENTSTLEKSNQTDTHAGVEKEEYTLTRVGNIGVKTVTAVLQEHTEFWSTWEFYSMIFGEICAELLLI